MNDAPKIKLGAVSYLNTRPLLEGLTFPIFKDVPARLLARFQAEEVDAALLSIYDVFQLQKTDSIEVVDNIGIGCRGAVYSVFLAYEGKLEEITHVRLDASSHTSNQLLKIILSEFYHLTPKYLEEPDATELPRLIIGDPAMTFREQATCSILDLGEEWYRFTKLPFVFAMWALRKNHPDKEYLSTCLRAAKERGLARRRAIAATDAHPDVAWRYLTEYIRYDVGKEEQQGLDLFRSLLKKHECGG